MVKILLEILTKGSQTFYKAIDVHFVTDSMGEIVSSVSMRIFVNKVSMVFLGVDFSFGQVVNNLKGKELFPDHDQINRKHLASIHGSRDRNCCTMENIRHRDSVET